MIKEKGNKTRYTLMRALQKTEHFLKKGADIFETVTKIGANPRPSTVIHAGVRLTQQAFGLGFFDSLRVDYWPWYYPGKAHFTCLLELLNTFPRKVVNNPGGTGTITYYDFYGKTIASQEDALFLRYLKGETNNKELEYLFARAIWEKTGSPCIMLASGGGGNDVTFEYVSASDKPIYKSKLCTEIMGRIKPFLEGEVSRSVMFHGPPGTGKSCIVDALAATFGSRVLAVDISNLSYCSSTVLTRYIIRLQPDVLVINDLDRFSGSDQMLTSLEELNKSLKLLLVTVNDKERLPRAILRPGRFDETIPIEYLDDTVALSLIGIPRNEIPDALFEELAKWPAAFITELGKRLTYLGKDKLVEEFTSLQKRVKENKPKEKE